MPSHHSLRAQPQTGSFPLLLSPGPPRQRRWSQSTKESGFHIHLCRLLNLSRAPYSAKTEGGEAMPEVPLFGLNHLVAAGHRCRSHLLAPRPLHPSLISAWLCVGVRILFRRCCRHHCLTEFIYKATARTISSQQFLESPLEYGASCRRSSKGNSHIDSCRDYLGRRTGCGC